jgi:hypothetical protein
MFFLFRLRILNLFIKVVFPDRHHHDTLMVSTPVPERRKFVRPPGGVPDFVEDVDDGLEEDEIRSDAWREAINDPDTIANARGFLEEQYRK